MFHGAFGMNYAVQVLKIRNPSDNSESFQNHDVTDPKHMLGTCIAILYIFFILLVFPSCDDTGRIVW